MEGEVITKKDYSKSFEELYGAPISKVYYPVIMDFFKEKHPTFSDRYWERKDGTMVYMGFIWISRHDDPDTKERLLETLTVEPLDGNQYEIAVRFKNIQKGEAMYSPHYMFSGYSINDWGTMSGFDTFGH